MVTLTRVDDDEPVVSGQTEQDELNQQLAQVAADLIKAEDEEEDEASEDEESDLEDDFDENETFMERIEALKDIISPEQRSTLISTYRTSTSLVQQALLKLGSGLWIFGTSVMLLGVPLGIAVIGEQQLMEMENQMNLQQSSNELLSGATEEPKA